MAAAPEETIRGVGIPAGVIRVEATPEVAIPVEATQAEVEGPTEAQVGATRKRTKSLNN